MREQGNNSVRGCTEGLLAGAMLIALSSSVGAQGVPPPAIHASAIVLDAQTGKVLFAHDAETPLPPASTTKIATGLLLAQKVSPDHPIQTSQNAAQTPGHALGMRPGETFTARDLLYAILLPSANDASEAVAEEIAGNDAAFAAMMNDLARSAGAKGTNFVNPHGLPASGHVSTAHDLALLARVAMQDPHFAAAVRTRTYDVPREGGRSSTTIINQNDLLGRIPGMDGVKTGYTREAGYCFVGSATRQGRRLITVVLHSSDWRRDTIALLDYGFAALGKTQEHASQGMVAAQSGVASDSTKVGQPDRQETETQEATPDDVSSSEAATTPVQALPDHTKPGTAQPPTTAAFSAASKPNSPSSRGQRTTSPTAFTPSSDITAPDVSHRPAGKIQGAPRYGIEARRYGWLEAGDAASIWQFFRWWWLLALLVALAWLTRKRGFAMRLPTLPVGAWKRNTRKQRVARTYESAENTVVRPEPVPQAARPSFSFQAPALTRHEGRPWLHSILDNAPRLLEPFVRRQARALLDADPLACDERVRALLSSNNPKLRVVGAELLAPHAPQRAEETLLALLEDEQTPPALRAEVVRLLEDIGGDRHEMLWTQMLLRDGTPAAASALARQARLADATRQALLHVLHSARPTPADNEIALRLQLRDAYIASVLAAHDGMSDRTWTNVLDRLPENHRYEVALNALTGVATAHATEKLVELALQGPAYTGMQALMDQDPESVRNALNNSAENMDSAARTRALILKWLLLGEGDRAAIQTLADAGNDLARGALQLAQQQRWDTGEASPDALLAAAQIISLRLGYTLHTPDQIAQAFRKVADEEERGTALAQAPELQILAHAYAHSEVYNAVQTGLHTEDGMHSLLAPLAMQPNNPAYRAELAFWADKMPRPSRLLLTQALATPQDEANTDPAAYKALVARASDHCPLIRATARRALHARPRACETPLETIPNGQEEVSVPVAETTMPPASDSDETLNQAA